MENVVDNKRKKTLIIVSILILVALIGITIAYFMSRSVSDEHTITSGNVAITYENESAFRLTGLVPLLESEVLDNAAKISFTVRNTGTMEAYVKINLTDITISNLASYDFKWALYEDTTKVTTGTFASLGDNTSINLANDIKLDQNESKNYNVYVWIDESGEDQTSLMKGTFKSKVEVIGLGTKEDTLASYILGENNSNVLTTIPTFSDTSTDKGLFVQKDDSEKSEFGFPTYYYRGAVENNYVQFGTYKANIINKITDPDSGDETDTTVAQAGDPIIWRIVRINEDGTIRLINENNIGDSWHLWAASGNAVYKGSSIEQTINNWYTTNTNLSDELSSKISLGIYCNDTSGIDGEYSNGSMRVFEDLNPIFTCIERNDIVEAKIGMITADEMMYAGALAYNFKGDNMTYLQNNTYFWGMTATGEEEAVLWEPHQRRIDIGYMGDSSFAAARPVINLKSDINISGGTGTKTDPYIIEE